MARVYNFSAGPSVLPLDVLQQAAAEMMEYGTSGQSVMEMSHRSSQFQGILDRCQSLLRELMNIPQDYDVLFLQGGASQQFAMVPLNLGRRGTADYVLTGQWAKKAYQEGSRFLDARCVASSQEDNFTHIPQLDPAKCNPQADYLHICYNNTIYGTCFSAPPVPPEGVPLVADLSSCILSQPVDVTRFGLIYAGAQKNMGPAGLTVVIVRKDLIGKTPEGCPTMLSYETHAKAGSLYNTPPTYAIYICSLVLQWLKDKVGGLEEMGRRNRQKAQLFYDYLDQSKLFRATVQGTDRSIMNIPFVTGDAQLDQEFVRQAQERGLVNLKGHRTVGGMRASLYNAMPLEGVQALIRFCQEFEKQVGAAPAGH